MSRSLFPWWRANNGMGRHPPTPKSRSILALSVGSVSPWHTSLVTNSESWERGGGLERISSTNRTAPPMWPSIEPLLCSTGSPTGRNKDEGSTHQMVRNPSAKHTANLRPGHRMRGTIAAVSATFHNQYPLTERSSQIHEHGPADRRLPQGATPPLCAPGPPSFSTARRAHRQHCPAT